MRDLYEILGVTRDASEDDIKRSYRRRARELHPDAGGDSDQFKELTAAYEVLRNPEARANYDRYGDPRGPGGRGMDFGGFGDLSDLIETFFGGFGGGGVRTEGRAGPQQGRDALVDVTLTLEEAARGVKREVEVNLLRACDTCAGSGAAPGTGPERCSTCGGAGAVRQVRNSVFGQVLTAGPCPDCGGSGRHIPHPCETCLGEGRRRMTETLTVDVPEGVDDGTRLRLPGRGEAGRAGGSAGDLFVRVRVRPHEVFTRDGNDLRCELELPMVQAALGARIVLPTLDGEQDLDVPPGTQTGQVLTLRRLGMPKLSSGGARGNLHVHCRVVTPADLDDEQIGLLRRLAELRGETADEPQSGKGLLSRLKGAFRV